MDKMREEFEEWHREKFKGWLQSGQPTRDMHNGRYAERYTVQVEQERWEAWQASRESFVLHLPHMADYVNMLGQVDKCYSYLDDLHAAIHAAGIRTK